MPSLDELDLSKWKGIRPISQMVYTALRECILSGTLSPENVLTELGVSKSFGVSRTPVREALRRLENERFLQNTSHRGLVVQDIRLTEAVSLYDVSIVLESYAARLAAENCTTQQLDVLRLLSEDPDSEAGTAAVLDINYRFHTMVAEASGNCYVKDYVRDIRDRMRLLQTALASAHYGDDIPTHRQVFDAISHKDAALAGELMSRHISAARAHFLQNQY